MERDEAVLATPESRRRAAQEALVEAIDLCLTPDGKPDAAGLGEAEDRFNRRMAHEVVAAARAYHRVRLERARVASKKRHRGLNVWTVIRQHDGTVLLMLDDCLEEGEAGARSRAAVEGIVRWARDPCFDPTPLAQPTARMFDEAASLGPDITGRPRHVESRMWMPWWAACADALTTPPDDGHPRPLDARSCAGSLALARHLLDTGARRIDAASARYVTGLPTNNDNIDVLDHTAHVWDDVTSQRVCAPLGWQYLQGWRIVRALLVGFVAAMERAYNTHAVYDALSIASLERDLAYRTIPSELQDRECLSESRDT
jgi:hypothetical protein